MQQKNNMIKKEDELKTKIRVALGSNDGVFIFPHHMGKADDFYIYDVSEDGNLALVEKRKNTSPDVEGEHGRIEKMKAVMEILKDVDVLIGRRMSPNFIRMAAQTGFQPVVVKIDRITDIMDGLKRQFSKVSNLIEQRQKGERPKEIPIINGSE
ncbi:hypothetical protein BXT86_03615 [candidate division WOR-3 bacterium 4484_100]|uniref:Dinitrogenase iron-molybdenum cofactor biosynthesis domain-containing protein n=1 Tax=candidate division WOR-3 bacterium 4484_100 TaxID=1936077 RepID=A0A1V4QF54_UNCW3|nr:MAG: hypothetical protein BXT86_03615 [candidate division WOR-3 bacterium 4484_100]